MLHLLILPMLAAAAAGAAADTREVEATSPPNCTIDASTAAAMPLPAPPPVFARRAAQERLMIFVHGLQGDALTSWRSRDGVYWPKLVASDTRSFGGFDIFVHEYVVRPGAPINLTRSVDQFVTLASQELLSQYRDVVFVAEGDGVFFVRELLRRVPPLSKRVTLIFVAGRVAETVRPLKTDETTVVYDGDALPWSGFRQREAESWFSFTPQPLTHCAVLGTAAGNQVTARDDGSSFCSTMPLVVQGTEWQDLRPTCLDDVIHLALRRVVGQYTASPAQTKAQPVSTHEVRSKSINVGCEQTDQNIVPLSFPFDPSREELLSVEPAIVDIDKLKAHEVKVERVVENNVALVFYRLTGLDLRPLPLPLPFPLEKARECEGGGHGTIRLTVRKRPKE